MTIKEFLRYALIIDINHHIKTKSIEVRKESKLKLPDAIIAATSISLNTHFNSR